MSGTACHPGHEAIPQRLPPLHTPSANQPCRLSYAYSNSRGPAVGDLEAGLGQATKGVCRPCRCKTCDTIRSCSCRDPGYPYSCAEYTILLARKTITQRTRFPARFVAAHTHDTQTSPAMQVAEPTGRAESHEGIARCATDAWPGEARAREGACMVQHRCRSVANSPWQKRGL